MADAIAERIMKQAKPVGARQHPEGANVKDEERIAHSLAGAIVNEGWDFERIKQEIQQGIGQAVERQREERSQDGEIINNQAENIHALERDIARLRPALVEATAALKPFAEFANKFDAHDGTKARVHEWYINIGTQWEASLKLSDCRRAAAKQAEAERVLGQPKDE